MLQRVLIALTTVALLSVPTYAQVNGANEINNLPSRNDTTLHTFTLEQCIAYALKNQPAVNQSHIDEEIARANRAIALSGFLPQVMGTANYQHYIELPTSFLNLNGTLTPIHSGVANSATPGIGATQNIFSNDE